MSTCRTRPSTSPTETFPSTTVPSSSLAAISPRRSPRHSKRYVDVEDGRREGFEEITVRVGPGGRKVRFSGVLLGEWANSSSSSSRWEVFRVYRSRTGKFVLHSDRTAEFTMVDAEGKPAGWRGYLGLGNVSYGSRPAESTLEVFDSLDQLRDKVPAQLYDMVAGSADRPAVEDLDI